MTLDNAVCLRVWGDYACFTRPEMKVERVSYDVMTPSAARGVLEAVLWKPQIVWRVTGIDVLKPIRWASVRRNEVKNVVPIDSVKTVMKRGVGALGQYADDSEKERVQRAALLLREVDYLIHARFELTERAGPDDTLVKYAAMFRRRAEKGQCFNQPYLGCREFSAAFAWVERAGPWPTPIAESRDLGWMLYDLEYRGSEPTPCFFRAQLDNGVVRVPAWDSEEIAR
ncbi:MAG TPA: type I-C CRISPR-associated protein Cas5c [Candidatus Competibacter sp.]|nr:type I-C CRISPR-associated protein Cas5 [Candidatus Competibacteraceae bacterium]HPE71793.1 type I-C CRISPR-associated protein Cas5c [Candidatus Competibacter sp.]